MLFVAQVANRSGSNLSKQPQRQLDHSGSLSVVSLKLSLAIRPPLQDCHWLQCHCVPLWICSVQLAMDATWTIMNHGAKGIWPILFHWFFRWPQKNQLLGKHLQMPPASSSSAASAALVTIGSSRFCFRFLREIGRFDRMIAEVCSASMTQSSPDLGKHGYLLARFKCKAGQFCRKGGLHSHKTLEKKNVLLSGLSLCNILHVICRQKHTETKSNH